MLVLGRVATPIWPKVAAPLKPTEPHGNSQNHTRPPELHCTTSCNNQLSKRTLLQADICRRDFIKCEGDGGGRRSAKGGASIKQLRASPRDHKRTVGGGPGTGPGTGLKKIKIETDIVEEKVGWKDLALALRPYVRENPELLDKIVNIIK